MKSRNLQINSKQEILILGAGPAGMSASFELHKAAKAAMIIEKNEYIGGLAATLQYGEFKTDIGPHRFFSHNKYLYDLIEDLLLERWIKVNRLTRFYINGKFFLYPIQLKDAFSNIGLHKTFKVAADYSFQKIKNILVGKKAESFEEQAVADFGRILAELNILNYTEKIWGLPCSEISPDWLKQRIEGLSVMEIIKKTLTSSKTKKGPKTLVEQFYYPDTGTNSIYEKMQERILTGGSIIHLKSYPVKIFHNNKKITEIIMNINGNDQIIIPDYVISSIPITEIINIMEPKAPDEVLKANKKLRYRSHISLFITLDKPSVFPDQWIYFPDKEIPFCRIMEPKNFSKKMSPLSRTSLVVEFFCWENDKIWNANKEELFDLSIKWLEKLNFIKEKEIIEGFIHKEKYAYPLYDLNYKDHLSILKNYLKQFKNLQCIGRAGSFKYNNQDHALEMGILAARNIIEGEKNNIEDVGTEQEYFEKGYIK
ncbi:MAG: NAD(P)-binding protein [bacterium]|nr:NAD(P)-binding protein [bacterium]